MKKYIIFECAEAGFNNIRMLLELAICISFLSNRILVLPPRIISKHFNPIYPHGTNLKLQNFFEFTYLYKYIDVISYNDFKNKFGEIKPNLKKKTINNSDNEYLSYCDWKGIIEYATEFKYNFAGNDVYCFGNIEKDDMFFNLFRDGRNIIHFSLTHKIYTDILIHFSRENFGLFYTVIYGNSKKTWSTLLKIINNGLKLKDRFSNHIDNIFKQFIPILENGFNAIHLRRGDFFTCHETYRKTIAPNNDILKKCNDEFDVDYLFIGSSNDKLKNIIVPFPILNINVSKYDIKTISCHHIVVSKLHANRWDTELFIYYKTPKIRLKTLYIAINDPNDNFDELNNDYNIITWNDIKQFFEIKDYMVPIYEMIICSKAQKFIGSYLSTFTSYIHRLRGNDSNYDKRLSWFTHTINPKKFPSWSSTNDLWAREFIEVWTL